MQRSFEFADSEISSVDTQDDTVVVRFAAALLHTNGEQGYTNGLCLVLQTATITGDTPHCIGRISAGHLRIHGERLTSLPVPSHYSAPANMLRLDLQMANGAWLQIDTCSLQCDAVAKACTVDVFQC
jgi:hypothetical protein